MQFNETLAMLRKSRGLTQEQLAERLGVSRQAIARWEAGETAPDVKILRNLCEIFGISADVLLNGADENPPSVSLNESADTAPTEILAKTSPALPLRTKLTFAAAVMAIAAVTVTVNIGIIKLSETKSQNTDSDFPRLTSLSNAPRIEFWTADEYEKWADEQLKIYREKFESGEEILWHTDSGDVRRKLTEEDVENIEKCLDETLAAIRNGDLFTKDYTIYWTAENGETYFVKYDDVFVTDGSGETAVTDEYGDLSAVYETVSEYSVAFGNSENAGTPLEEIFAKYEKYGLKYSEDNGNRRLYYNGKAVGKFIDADPEGGVFVFTPDGGDTLTVQTEYDWNGGLSGVYAEE